MALRAPRSASIVVAGEDVVPKVHAVLDAMVRFAERVRSGELSGRLAGLLAQVGETLEEMQRSAQDQEAAVEETAALQTRISTSIRSINGEVMNLARANDESASSILELGSAVEQVARSAFALQENVESSTSSLH